MRFVVAVPVLVALLIHHSPLGAQSTEAEIRGLEQQWALASLHGDTAAFNRLMAPDFRSIRTDGLVMTRVDRLRAFGSGDVRTTALDLSGLNVRVDGNTAIVTGLAPRVKIRPVVTRGTLSTATCVCGRGAMDDGKLWNSSRPLWRPDRSVV